MDLNKHIINNDGNRPFHSSGFARIASGNRVGSTGNTSFNQRQKIDQERRLIYGYSRSKIGSSYSALRPKPVPVDQNKIIPLSPLQQRNSRPIAVPQRPANPSPQSYNPYA
jgi:hypothetical protein